MRALDLVEKYNHHNDALNALKCSWHWFITYTWIVDGSVECNYGNRREPRFSFWVRQYTSDSRRPVQEGLPTELHQLQAVLYLKEQWELWCLGQIDELPEEPEEPEYKLVDGEWQTVWKDGDPWLRLKKVRK